MKSPKQAPTPRESNYLGMRDWARIEANGTWLEPESLCYPHGGQPRYAYAQCPDGVNRKVKCGMPDTWFSIPASVVIRGKYITGYVCFEDAYADGHIVTFRVHTSYHGKFTEATGYKFATN